MKKTVNILLAAMIALTSVAAYAKCGDSKCAFEDGQFKCVAETPDGNVVCTESNPCNIKCP